MTILSIFYNFLKNCIFSRTFSSARRSWANYDTETVTCMGGLNDGEIHFTSMNVDFKRS